MDASTNMDSICGEAEYFEIGGRHPTGSASKRTYRDPAIGLTGHLFDPVLEEDSRCLSNWEQKEGEFFNSLSFLAQLYQFEPLPKSYYPYPKNVLIAFQEATDHIKMKFPDVETCILADDKHCAVIGTYLTLTPEFDLYYIPIESFNNLLKDKSRYPESQLLYSIFSYLIRVVKIDHYCQRTSYLFYIHQMMRESEMSEYYTSDGDNESLLKDIDLALEMGHIHYINSNDIRHLRQFRKRVDTFQISDQTSTDLLLLATMALELFEQYPQKSISDSFRYPIQHPYAEDEDQGPVRGNEYLSFIWDTEGHLGDSIIDYVNSDHQENRVFDKPMCLQIFDTFQDRVTLSLDFEERIFRLLNDLSGFLIYKIWKT